MKLVEMLRNIFTSAETINVNQKLESARYQLAVEDFAIQMAINLIAGTIAKCEFRTMLKGKQVKGDDYYTFNVEPNKNQNSNQFWHEVVAKMLYYNECLVVEMNGQLIIADSFTHDEYALFPDKFSNVTRKDFTFLRSFSADEVLYFTYANKDIRALLSGVMAGYADLLTLAVGKYKRAGGRKGVVKTGTTPIKDEKWQKALDDLYGRRFKSYYNDENALVVLPQGVEYEEITGEGSKKSTSEVGDIAKITEEAFTRVAQAFKINPSLLLGNIANVDSVVDEFLTFCIDHIVDIIATEVNRKYYGKKSVLAGSCLKINTMCIKHIDIFSIAEKADKLISDGIFCIDEIRELVGAVPLDTWWSKKHWLTKNLADLEGGETQNE